MTAAWSSAAACATVEEWIAWLKANPQTVEYTLATPVTEHVDHVDLPEAFHGTTVVTTDSPYVRPELEVTYVEDGTLALNRIRDSVVESITNK